jgi:hypothetical protein
MRIRSAGRWSRGVRPAGAQPLAYMHAGSIRPVAGRTYTKRHAGPGEIAMYRILGALAPACNDRFTTLQLPAATRIDPGRGQLVLPRYDGDDLAARWSEADGGARLPVTLSGSVVAILEDLAPYRHRAGDRGSGAVGDPRTGLRPFRGPHPVSRHRPPARPGRPALRPGLRRAGKLLARRQHTLMIVNNGDFYPRNLIIRPGGRIVIVDWETWNPSSPFHTIDHPENVAAVFYVHMWGNPAWQAAYRAALSERFAFSEISFAKRVVIAALELARMWMTGTDRSLAAIQASIITSTLARTAGG